MEWNGIVQNRKEQNLMKLYGMEWNSIEQKRIEFNEIVWNGMEKQNSIELYRRK